MTLLIACSQPGISRIGYSALELKNSGIVMACPIPISRSRLRARPAIDIDRQEKNAEPSTTTQAAASSFSGLPVIATPRMAASTTITTPWTSDRSPAAKDLPVISAERGVGVTMSLASTPASRSQMIWMP